MASWRLLVAPVVALLAAGVALLAGERAALAQGSPVPPLEARVTDQTGTLTAAQQAQLEARLAEFEARKGAQIAVLIVPTTAPEEIEQYSIRVVDAWKIGRAKPDDGVLLLVARDDRALRIEVGYGLEGALTDLVSKRIIADTITPLFRQGDYAGGIGAGVEQMMRVIDGEALPEPDQRWQGAPGPADSLPMLIAAFFIASVVLRALLGRVAGSLATGVVTGGLAWFLSHVLPIAAVAGAGRVPPLAAVRIRRAAPAGPVRHGPVAGAAGGFGGGGFGGGGGGFGGGGWSRRRWGRLRGRRRLRAVVSHGARLARLLRHLFVGPAGALGVGFTPAVLAQIESEVRAVEARHAGEIRFAVEAALDGPDLWRRRTPRERALQCSRNSASGIPRPTTAC